MMKLKDGFVIKKDSGELLCCYEYEDTPVLFIDYNDAFDNCLPNERVLRWKDLSSEECPKVFVLYKPNKYFTDFIVPLN